jgi:hypothetical protein
MRIVIVTQCPECGFVRLFKCDIYPNAPVLYRCSGDHIYTYHSPIVTRVVGVLSEAQLSNSGVELLREGAAR